MNRLRVLSFILSANPVFYSMLIYLVNYQYNRLSFFFAILILFYTITAFKHPRLGYGILVIPPILSTIMLIITGDASILFELAVGNLLALPAIFLYSFYEERDVGISLTFYFLAYLLALLLATISVSGAKEPLQFVESIARLLLAIDIGIFGSFVRSGVNLPTISYLRDLPMVIATLTASIGIILNLVKKPSSSDEWRGAVGIRGYRVDLFTKAALISTLGIVPFVLVASIHGQNMLFIIGLFLLAPTTYIFSKVRRIRES